MSDTEMEAQAVADSLAWERFYAELLEPMTHNAFTLPDSLSRSGGLFLSGE